MNKIIKLSLLGLLSLSLMVGMGGVAQATVTLSDTSVTSNGVLTLTGATTSAWSTSAGTLTITGDEGVSLIATNTGDVAITATTHSVVITGAQAVADAVYIHASVGGMTLQTAGTTTHGLDITTAATTVDGIDISAGNTTHDVFDIDAGELLSGDVFDISAAKLTTGNIINIASPSTRTDGSVIQIDDLGVTATANAPTIDVNLKAVTDQPGLDISYDNAINGIGDLIYMDVEDALAAGALVIVDGGGNRTDAIIDVTTTSTGAGNVIDINSDSTMSGNALDVTYATDAATGNAVDLNMGTNLAGNALDIAILAGRTDGSAIVINDAGLNASVAEPTIDVNITGTTDKPALDITFSAAAIVGGNAIDLNMGASAVANDAINIASAATTGNGLIMAMTALTTGEALAITQTGEALAAGELLMITNTENGDISSTPKTGNLCSITSSVTATTADTSLDYDAVLIDRSNISNNAGFTLTASGSVLKLSNTSTDTGGICTDSTVVLEVVQVEGGTAAPTGDVVKVTSVGVGAKAINVVSGSTTVSDVLITGSGAKADNKAVLEVVSTGATASGGSLLRVAPSSGIPAAADSYLVDFDYSAATVATNDPISVYINGGISTGSTLHVTGAEAIAAGAGNIEILNTDADAVGAVLLMEHTSASEADDDVVGRISYYGLDDGDNATEYAKIDAIARDITDAGSEEDGSIEFHVRRGSASKQILELGWNDGTGNAAINGIMVGDGAGAGIVSSNGSQNLILETDGGTNSGTITITTAANGAINLTPNGTGTVIVDKILVDSSGILEQTADATGDLTAAELRNHVLVFQDTVTDTITLTFDGDNELANVIPDGGSVEYIFINESGAVITLAADTNATLMTATKTMADNTYARITVIRIATKYWVFMDAVVTMDEGNVS